MKKLKKQKNFKKKVENIIIKTLDILEIIFILFCFTVIMNFLKNNVLGTAEVIALVYSSIRLITLYTQKANKI